jgi:nicotinate-nucleotide adenylyltransferase
VRIGVFGGTFDPPHIGHLLVANDAREALELDRLIFVPVGAQPFKVDTPPVASGQDRLEMVRLAVADDANYVVDDAEINRKGLSFTVDTLEHLSERNPAARLFLLMGEDVLAGFEKWRSPARIRELATLVAVSRGGLAESVADPATSAILRVSTRRVDVSSTEIRERRRAGKSIKGFVPESVERFIDVRGLYR